MKFIRPKNLMRLFIFAIAGAAHAYQPFVWKDPTLYAREDLKPGLRLLAPSLESNSSFQGISLPDVHLTFFFELADFLNLQRSENLVFNKNYVTNKSLTECLKPLEAWTQNNNHNELSYLQNIKQMCIEVFEPDHYLKNRFQGDVSIFKLVYLLSMFETLAEPLMHIKDLNQIHLPKNFFTVYYKIILKMRYKEIKNKLQELHLKTAYKQDQNISKQVLELNHQIFLHTSKHLTNIYQQGVDKYHQDQSAVNQQGRYRPSLPYPFLSDSEREFIAFYLGALAWRARGGGLVDDPQGTQKTRLYFNFIPFSILGNLTAGTEGRSIAQAIFFRIFKGWGKYMDMGRTPNENDKFHDLTRMTQRGYYQVASTVGLLQEKKYFYTNTLAGGLQMGPCYYFSWEILPQMIGGQLKKPYAPFIDGPTSWGELCTGAAISLGLAKDLLSGKIVEKNY